MYLYLANPDYKRRPSLATTVTLPWQQEAFLISEGLLFRGAIRHLYPLLLLLQAHYPAQKLHHRYRLCSAGRLSLSAEPIAPCLKLPLRLHSIWQRWQRKYYLPCSLKRAHGQAIDSGWENLVIHCHHVSLIGKNNTEKINNKKKHLSWTLQKGSLPTAPLLIPTPGCPAA